MTRIRSKGKLWKYSGDKASWFFLTLTPEAKKQIDELKGKRKGWGQVAVEVALGSSVWKTSVFPDKKLGYVLPIKAIVRKKEKISEGDELEVNMILA